MENKSKLVEISNNISLATPQYKLDNFVGGAQITPYARLKQWMMELRAREDAVQHLEILVEKKEIEISIEEEKLEFLTDDFKKRLVFLEIKDGQIDLRKYKRNLKDAIKERDDVAELINNFLESDEGKLPNGESFLEVFNSKELQEKYEHEYWTVRMAKQAMLDMVAYGRIGTGNLDSILMMHPTQQQQVLSLAAQFTVSIDKNMNILLGKASTGQPLPEIEQKLKEQLKIGSVDTPTNEQLL